MIKKPISTTCRRRHQNGRLICRNTPTISLRECTSGSCDPSADTQPRDKGARERGVREVDGERVVGACGGSPQLLQQRLCLFQIGRVETFREPAIDGREKLAGFGSPALVTAEAGEAHRGAQFPELGLLLSGDA